MPRHPPANARKEAVPEPVAAVKPRGRKPRAVAAAAAEPVVVAAEPVVVAAEPAEKPVPKARKPPSEAQLANRKRFAEQVARAKQLRAEDPKLTQREAMARAK